MLEYWYRPFPLNTPMNVTVSPISIPMIYFLVVNPSVLIDVTDRSALDPCLVSDMGGSMVSFTKGDP